MHFVDGSAYEYLLKSPITHVLNVGWLEPDHAYARGVVESWVLERLAAIILSSGTVDVHVNRMRGYHPCALSAQCAAPVRLTTDRGSCGLGASELWISAGDRLWAAPSLVYHYIDQHQYQPPTAFLEALQAFRLDAPFKAQMVYQRLVAGHF